MATITTLKSGTSRDTTVFSTGTIPTDGDKTTVSKLGTATSRTTSALINSGAVNVPVTAGTGTGLVTECIEFDVQPGVYYELTTGFTASAGTAVVTPALTATIPSGATFRLRGHKVLLQCANRLTDAAGYAIGATVINLQAGSLGVLTGSMVRFGADAVFYKVATGNGTGASSITLAAPGLTTAIPASATVCNEALVWGDDTTTGVNINGVLYWPRDHHGALVAKGQYLANAIGREDRGSAADPLTNFTAGLYLNYSATMAISKYGATYAGGASVYWYGKPRKRIARLTAPMNTGEVTMQVDDATGWAGEDTLVLMPTLQSSPIQLEEKVIGIGGVSGLSITVPAVSFARQTGAYILNISSNVITTDYSQSFGSAPITMSALATGVIDEKYLRHCLINNFNTGFVTPVTMSTSAATGARQLNVDGMVIQSRCTASPLSIGGVIPGPFTNSIVYQRGTGTGVVTVGTDISDCAFVASNGQALTTGTSNLPNRNGNIRRTLLAGARTFTQNFTLASLAGAFEDNVSMVMLTLAGNARPPSITTPGISLVGTDFAPFGMGDQPSFGFSAQNGFSTLKGSKFTNTPLAPPYGTFPDCRVTSMFGNYYGGTQGKHEIWDNEGYAYSDTATRNRGDASLNVSNRTTSPFTYSSTAAITNGETKRVIGYLRRNATYAAGSMPTITLSIPGVTSVVSSVTDTADTWFKADLSITNTTGSTKEITVTLSANGTASASSSAWFDGIPIYPFIQAVRHYGFLLDEANPFRVVDPYNVLSESAALALTGIAVDHTAHTITVTSAHTASEVYDYCCANWCGVMTTTTGLPRHISSTNGVSFSTTYTVVLSGAGAITGRYTDATGTTVPITVSGVVSGSRILIVRTDTNAVLANAIVSGTSYSVSLTTASAVPVAITLRKASAAPYYQEWATTGSVDPLTGFAAVANQQPD